MVTWVPSKLRKFQTTLRKAGIQHKPQCLLQKQCRHSELFSPDENPPEIQVSRFQPGARQTFLRPQPQAFSAQGVTRLCFKECSQAVDKSVKAMGRTVRGCTSSSKMCRLGQGGAPARRLRQKMREVGGGFKGCCCCCC